jgi:hypothetical protein
VSRIELEMEEFSGEEREETRRREGRTLQTTRIASCSDLSRTLPARSIRFATLSLNEIPSAVLFRPKRASAYGEEGRE